MGVVVSRILDSELERVCNGNSRIIKTFFWNISGAVACTFNPATSEQDFKMACIQDQMRVTRLSDHLQSSISNSEI